MGANMAENHPVGFRFVMKAKERGATLIHIDPRFSRTSAMADLHVSLRAGSDLVFLGALINYVVNDERWKSDAFFRDYVTHYTNAANLVGEEFRDTEDLDGVFSGYDRRGAATTPRAGRWSLPRATTRRTSTRMCRCARGARPRATRRRLET